MGAVFLNDIAFFGKLYNSPKHRKNKLTDEGVRAMLKYQTENVGRNRKDHFKHLAI